MEKKQLQSLSSQSLYSNGETKNLSREIQGAVGTNKKGIKHGFEVGDWSRMSSQRKEHGISNKEN